MKILFFIAFSIALAAAADPYVAGGKKIRTLLSNFCTLAQIKTLTNWVLDQGYDGKQLDDIKDQLIAQGMNVLTTAQKAKATQMYSKMSTDMGGASKAQALLTILMDELSAFIKPFADKVNTVMQNQKKAGKAKAACKKAALTQANKFLTKANIVKAINNMKKKFTPAQCQTAFKHLAPTYIFLGKYNFLNPPCTGKGA